MPATGGVVRPPARVPLLRQTSQRDRVRDDEDPSALRRTNPAVQSSYALSRQGPSEAWEEYFELTKVQDAHDRRRCKDQNGSEPWACGGCDCTDRLERKLDTMGEPFLDCLRRAK
ncbi:MAG: hypothetical protein ACLQOO_08400 [Terriglobia bacterium]